MRWQSPAVLSAQKVTSTWRPCSCPTDSMCTLGRLTFHTVTSLGCGPFTVQRPGSAGKQRTHARGARWLSWRSQGARPEPALCLTC